MASNFKSSSVKELQDFLKQRGVTVAHQRKLDLISLCEAAHSIGLDVDPDGLTEDRNEILDQKLTTPDGQKIINPAVVSGIQDLSILPMVLIFDVYNYLVSFKDIYSHAILKEYHKMEGHTMFEDGYVLAMETAVCVSETGPLEKYFSLKSHVKPRTNEKDPLTKKPYYSAWLILTNDATHQGGSIFSAFCGCRGGIDGSCRHIVATLFELIDFIDDAKKKSVTSGDCQWVRRAKDKEDPVLVTDLETSYIQSSEIQYPNEENYTPLEPEESLPDNQSFMSMVKECCPTACILDSVEVRQKRHYPETVPTLPFELPFKKMQSFIEANTNNETCSAEELISHLKYESEEIDLLEKSTRGQHDNVLWHEARKGMLTASNFKDIIHCRDMDAMALKLISPSSISEDRLPAPIAFGRNYENKARMAYIRNHRYHHRKCNYFVPGFMISKSNEILGASPDCIVNCNSCGSFLVEVKCLYSHRNFHPKSALIVSKICEQGSNDELTICKTHKYYYQIQGQMAVAGIKRCILVAYTHRGTHAVEVMFDPQFWSEKEHILSKFFDKAMFPALCAKFKSEDRI